MIIQSLQGTQTVESPGGNPLKFVVVQKPKQNKINELRGRWADEEKHGVFYHPSTDLQTLQIWYVQEGLSIQLVDLVIVEIPDNGETTDYNARD